MSSQSRGAQPGPARHLHRRTVLGGASGAALAAPLVAACGADADTEAPLEGAADPTPAPASPSAPASTPSPSETPVPEPGGGAVGVTSTDDVPVGSGVVIADSRVVVTQPSSGDLRCFSAVCTHSGCLVAAVTSTILCTCHNSSFDIATGEVLGGPAPAPLPPVDFTIIKDQVVLS